MVVAVIVGLAAAIAQQVVVKIAVRAGAILLAIVAVGEILAAMVASEIIVGIAMAAVRRNVRFMTVGKRRLAKIA